MSEYAYYNLSGEEILRLFATLPEAEEGDVILLHKGCRIGEIDEEDFFDVLSKGWSVVA